MIMVKILLSISTDMNVDKVRDHGKYYHKIANIYFGFTPVKTCKFTINRYI